MSGAEIAAEVSAALGEAAAATGSGRRVAVLRKRLGPEVGWSGAQVTNTDADTTVLEVRKRVFDGPAMVARYVDMLLFDPLGPVPAKGDQVALGILSAAVTDATVWRRIADVDILAPAGTALLYKATLEG